MTKKKHITKGFLSQGGNPTQNSLIMFFIYLSWLPVNWNENEINKEAVTQVRNFFGWKYESGFDMMIKWGISVNCAKSKTSKKRYVAMSKAYHDAKGMIGKGYVFTSLGI
jgi:hypothetical protein